MNASLAQSGTAAFPSMLYIPLQIALLGEAGVGLTQTEPRASSILCCSLSLRTDDIKKAARHWLGGAYGFLSILLITPCLGFALRELPLTPPEFAIGAAGGRAGGRTGRQRRGQQGGQLWQKKGAGWALQALWALHATPEFGCLLCDAQHAVPCWAFLFGA